MGTVLVLLFVVLLLGIVIVAIAGIWKVYEKAGEPGWAAIVPIYNYIVMLKIVGKPWWWILFGFIPFVGGIIALVLHVIVLTRLAEAFGKGGGYAIGLFLLPFVFYPM